MYFKISLVTFNGIIYKLRYNRCYEYNIIVQVVDNCLYDLITGKKIIMKCDRIENHYLKKLDAEDIARYKLAIQSLEEEAKGYVMKYSKKL